MRAGDGPDSALDPPGRRSRLKPGGLTCGLPDVCEAGPHLRSPLQIRDAQKTDRGIPGADNAPPAGLFPWRGRICTGDDAAAIAVSEAFASTRHPGPEFL